MDIRRGIRNALRTAGGVLSDRRAARGRQLARRICDPGTLPQLSGTPGEVSRAEELRRKTLAHMALHRAEPAHEMAVLSLIGSWTEAAWWTDIYYAGGSVAGIWRLLNRRAARKLRKSKPAGAKKKAPVSGVRYFVDGENVSPRHAGMRELLGRPGVHIVLFVSEHCQWPKAEAKIQKLCTEATLERIDCGTGAKNAMDFQLVGVVGEYLATHPGGAAYIVSNDTGYDAAVKMWTRQGFSVGRIGSREAGKSGEAGEQSAARSEREKMRALAMASLHWNGYQADEKERLAEILTAFVRGEYDPPYSKDVHAAIGHYMKCGNRYMPIYAAEKKNIDAFLDSAKAVA